MSVRDGWRPCGKPSCVNSARKPALFCVACSAAAHDVATNADPRDTITDPAVAAVINRVAQDASRAAKNGKTPFELVDLQFIASMARQLGAGLDKAGRVADGWRTLDPADWLLAYRAAMLRHVVACDTPHAVDRETGEPHYAAVAVNAMICCVFERMLAERAEHAASIVDDTQLALPLEGAERPSKARAVSDD